MPDETQTEELIRELDETLTESLTYLTGDGNASGRVVGGWGAWEILCHMIYWHRATAEGVESVADGGRPRQIEAETDELNARIIASMTGKSMEELEDEVRELHARLVSAVRTIPDPTSPVFVRRSGAASSTDERLRMMAGHWRNHVQELKAAPSTLR